MKTTEIDNSQDIIDSRDVIARIAELEDTLTTSEGKFSGCFDGLRGLEIAMEKDAALSASHSGQCDVDVAELLNVPEIAAQLDAMGADEIRDGLRESGAYDEEELADDAQNRNRAVWMAACDIRERLNEYSDELEEYEALLTLAEEAEGYAADWEYGETLIRDSYFKDYAMQFAEDIGAINKDATWPNNCIDWEKAVGELQVDYTAVDFGGVTYWIR